MPRSWSSHRGTALSSATTRRLAATCRRRTPLPLDDGAILGRVDSPPAKRSPPHCRDGRVTVVEHAQWLSRASTGRGHQPTGCRDRLREELIAKLAQFSLLDQRQFVKVMRHVEVPCGEPCLCVTTSIKRRRFERVSCHCHRCCTAIDVQQFGIESFVRFEANARRTIPAKGDG